MTLLYRVPKPTGHMYKAEWAAADGGDPRWPPRNGAIVSGVSPNLSAPGKDTYATASGTDGVLIGWTPRPDPLMH